MRAFRLRLPGDGIKSAPGPIAPLPEDQPRFDAASGVTNFSDRDPFHYRERDLVAAANLRDWEVECLRGWGHPRGQWMGRFGRR
jgi:hypothetical protein